MIRSLRAIIWLRWRLLANSLRGGRRRDKMEQISRALAVFVPLLLVALSFGSVVAASVLGFLAGRAVATGLVEPGLIVFIFRIALAILVMVLLVLTAGSPAQTTLGRYTRLLLLPIPRRVLHLVEVLANLADPWLALMASGLVAFGVGMLAGGRPGAALVAAAAGLAVLGVLATLASCLSFMVGWLFRGRRRGELFTLVFVLSLSLVSFVPMYLSRQFDSRKQDARREEARQQTFSVEEFDQRLPFWSRAFPPELYGRAVRAGVAGNATGAALAIAALVIEASLLFSASSVAHRKMLGSLEGEGRRSRRADARTIGLRLPILGPTASAVAWAQFRTALRSVRGRLIVLLPGPMVALMTTLFRNMPGEEGWALSAVGHGHLLLGAGIIFCFYSLAAFSMNLFASDRAGLTLQLLAPVSDRQLAWGKVAGCAMIFAAAIGVAVLAIIFVAPTGSLFSWLAVLVGAAATYLLLSPIAVWLSALFPQASDLSKTGAGGNPHPLPMFVGTFLVLILAAPAGAILAAAEFWLERPALALPAMLVWTLLAAVVAIPFVSLASRTIGARRENLALTAQGR